MFVKVPKETAQTYIEVVEVFGPEFLQATCERLFQLMRHPKSGVRLYTVLFLTDMALNHFSAFSSELLADVAFHVKQLADNDSSRGIREVGQDNFNKLINAVVAYGAACRAAQQHNQQTDKRPKQESRN